MARCPFAIGMPISGPVGAHAGGPYEIVHHAAEGSTAAGAFGAFRQHRSDPHFTVDANGIHPHIDTAPAARALRNAPDGVQTNRDGAPSIAELDLGSDLLPDPGLRRARPHPTRRSTR